jgi:polyisoprenoid-binding protein YceI
MAVAILTLSASFALEARAQSTNLQCDPSKTSAKITLGDVLHTVHGEFRLKRCELHYDSSSGKLDGEIAFDTASGETGNASRDRKMHKDVLQSTLYPEITFRPDHVVGNVAPNAASTVQVHGLFGIHGSEHELTVPAEVTMESDRWSVSTHFSIPYVRWGMKNPSVLFLRVGDSVEVVFEAAGTKASSP